jgi:hypothetical protein
MKKLFFLERPTNRSPHETKLWSCASAMLLLFLVYLSSAKGQDRWLAVHGGTVFDGTGKGV